jgi:hypothetical protein
MQCMIRVRRRAAGTFVKQRRESSDKYQRDIQRFSEGVDCTDMVSGLNFPSLRATGQLRRSDQICK